MTPWADLSIDVARTHHCRDGAPMYSDRYDEVHEFRAPGLAPVRINGQAWHIKPDGSPAYTRRFIRTFGFYETLAAVVDHDGWHHINATGLETYPHRFAWTGNFQGGRCAVRSVDGLHWHIDKNGAPSYDRRWRYVGDFREGVAVVQAEDGQSTHIDVTGTIVHGSWFRDLDAPHKGFSRARDADGWFHVDRYGQAAYAERFAMIEPFYNGYARVETLRGTLAIIDESGTVRATLCAERL